MNGKKMRWMMNKSVKFVKNRLSLRKPQEESLVVFHDICELLSLEKHPATLEDLREQFVEELSALTMKKKKPHLSQKK